MAVSAAIVKSVPDLEVTPNLPDYEAARTPDFWELSLIHISEPTRH